MGTEKVAITIDGETLKRLDRLVKEHVFPNRSKAIQEAVQDKIKRFEKSRLARECEKLDPTSLCANNAETPYPCYIRVEGRDEKEDGKQSYGCRESRGGDPDDEWRRA